MNIQDIIQKEFQKYAEQSQFILYTPSTDFSPNPFSNLDLQALKTILTILKNAPESAKGAQLLGFKGVAHRRKVERQTREQRYYDDHEYLQRVCYGCGLFHSIPARCKNRACTTCRYGLYRELFDRLMSILQHVAKSSHLIHQVFTMRSLPVTEVCPRDIIDLRDAFVKIREQHWFNNVVAGGFFYIEMNFNLEEMMCNPHIHALLETTLPGRKRPLNITQGNTSWKRLTKGGNVQTPQSLKTYEDAVNICAYITKQEHRGEPTLNHLSERISTLKTEFNTTYDTVNNEEETDDITNLVADTLRCLREEIQMSEELRFELTRIYNTVFADQRRYGFFGSWYGKNKTTIRNTGWSAIPAHSLATSSFDVNGTV